MIFGRTELFGIEVSDSVRGIASIRLWVDGLPFGDFEQQSVLNSLQLDAARFLSSESRRQLPELARRPPEQIRQWHADLLAKDAHTEEAAAAIDRLIESVQLFAFAPEGLSAVRVLVVCDGPSCSVTAWDVTNNETSRVKIPMADVHQIISEFAAWKEAP